MKKTQRALRAATGDSVLSTFSIAPGGLHLSIAEAMPPLSHLECLTCGERIDLSVAGAAGYLRSGWPKCHGATMRLFTKAEAEAREAPQAPSRSTRGKKGPGSTR